jgi:hypothetical protein
LRGVLWPLERLLGDPIDPPAADKAAPPRFDGLLVLCGGLLLVCFVALCAAYGFAGPQWRTMFDHLAHTPAEVPHDAEEQGAFSSGFFVELFREVLYVGLCLFWVVGMVFHEEARQLLPYAPWRSDVGRRRLTLRSLFRAVTLALGLALAVSTVYHHVQVGPAVLWRCNGNPFLEPYLKDYGKDPPQAIQDIQAARESFERLSGEDKRGEEGRQKLAELQQVIEKAHGDDKLLLAIKGLPEKDRLQMIPRPDVPEDTPGDAEQYQQFRQQCVLPYLLYLPYSLVNFVAITAAFLAVTIYALCLAVWTHAVQQNRRMAKLCKSSASEQDLGKRFASYQNSTAGTLRKLSAIVLFLLIALWYGFWLDRYNLTITGFQDSWKALVVMLVFCVLLVGVVWVAYDNLVDTTARALPEGERRKAFRRQNASWKFFRERMFAPGHFPICVLAGLTGVPLWLVVSWWLHWQR